MQKYRLKITVGLLALLIGITIVWASGLTQMLMPAPAVLPVPDKFDEPLQATSPNAEETGKVLVKFKGFAIYKAPVARFEISNYTSKPITYIGFKSKSEFDFCTLVARREEIIEETGAKSTASGTKTIVNCQESKAAILQTLEPNERVIFAVFKNDVEQLVRLNGKYQNAQIGFEFFIGDEKRREIFWSEDITFPTDEK